MDAIGNKESIAIRGPIQGIQVIPALHIKAARGVASQGNNFNRLLRSPEVGKACAIRRKIPVELLGFAVQVNSSQLGSATLQWVELREEELFAIFAQLDKHTYAGWKPCATKLTVRASGQNQLGCSPCDRHAHDLL